MIDEYAPPRSLRGRAGKVVWEQTLWPRQARHALGHVPYLAPPVLAPRAVVTVHDVIPLALPAYGAGRGQALYLWLGSRGSATVTHADCRFRMDPPRSRQAGRRAVEPSARRAARRRQTLLPGWRSGAGRRPSATGVAGQVWTVSQYPRPAKESGRGPAAWPEVWRACRLPLVIAGRAPRKGSRVYVDWFRNLDPSAEAWLRVFGRWPSATNPDLYRAGEHLRLPVSL